MPTLVFDADDTLWENNVLFERVIGEYLAWLGRPEGRTVLDDVERANVTVHGYGAASFQRSLHDAFPLLTGRSATAADARRVTELAAVLTNHEVELVPGVAETLAELGARHELLLLTKGDAADQQRKLDASNLAHHFRSVHIVAEKRAPTYRKLVADEGLDVAGSWMIGNSPASDILPARAVGLGAVFIPNPHTWVLEHDELDHTDDGVLHLERFTQLVEHF